MGSSRRWSLFGCVLIAATIPSSAMAKDAPVTTSQAAQAKKAVKLASITPWNLNYAESRCRLVGVFGSEENRNVLLIEQAAPEDRFSVTVAGLEIEKIIRARRIYVGMQDDIALKHIERPGRGSFGDMGSALIVSGFSLRSGGERANSAFEAGDPTAPIASKFSEAGVNVDAASTANRVVIKGRDRVLSFETGPMAEAFAALNTCTSNLLEQWGLDPEQHRQYQEPVFTDLKRVSLEISKAYPDAALRRRQSAVFKARLIIEADGKVSECHLEKMTLADRLDSPACKIMMRKATFKPALDRNGKPMRSFYSTSITYSIN